MPVISLSALWGARLPKSASVLLLGLLALPSLAQARSWEDVTTPSPGESRSIGRPTQGCLAGGVALPLDGQGFHVLRPQRHRYYGQPVLVATLTGIAKRMSQAGHGAILIGDMSQPRGGRMPSGHSSHQTGLDADIWLKSSPPVLSDAERRDPQPVSMVEPRATRADPTLWSPAQADLVRFTAEAPAVARVFVNPAIKATLCQSLGVLGSDNGPAWLRKVRPWRGHDEHLHLRLTCPAGNKDCENQDSPPAGSGCGDELESWLNPPPAPLEPPKTPVVRPPAPKLPAACQAVLKAR